MDWQTDRPRCKKKKKKRELGMTSREYNALRIYLSSVEPGKRMRLH